MWLFPLDRAASLTVRVFVTLLVLSFITFCVGFFLRRRRVTLLGLAGLAAAALSWSALYLARPAWMRYALDETAPFPNTSPLTWATRADGLETSEVAISVDGHWVDRVVLARIDPARYRFIVRWDGANPRTIDEWQEKLGAQVVMNGSYFEPDLSPRTPLRIDGHFAGPARYQSQHAAFIGDDAGILDLKGRTLPDAINGFSDAMVSYPVLVDTNGTIRAQGQRDWLASRSFVAVDSTGRVIFGTTHTGYFSLRRLAEWIKDAPLDARVALNLDGGRIAGQAVAAPGFSRVMIGSAEINRGSDVLRAFWQGRRTRHWLLPIVVAAVPR